MIIFKLLAGLFFFAVLLAFIFFVGMWLWIRRTKRQLDSLGRRQHTQRQQQDTYSVEREERQRQAEEVANEGEYIDFEEVQ